MSKPSVIDIDSLLLPISNDWPQGSDLRLNRSPSSDYYTIKDARNTARAAERSSIFGDEEVDLLSPWTTVNQLAPNILINTSKDLEVACWYLESLIRLEGIAGLRDGIKLIKLLVEQYWQNLYPLPDEDGLETRVAPLTGLNGDGGDGTLIIPIRNVALTQDGDFGEFNLWQFQQARDADRIVDEDEKQARYSSLGYSLSNIRDTVNSTHLDYSIEIIETLEECSADYKSLALTLRNHCGEEAPPTNNITNLLDEVSRTARFLYKDKIEAAAQREQFEADKNVNILEFDSSIASNANGPKVAQNMNGSNGQITNREDALKRLEAVANYFRHYEPHTPIAASLERVVGWGRLSVSELMMQLLPDDQARGFYSQLTGVKLDVDNENLSHTTDTQATVQNSQNSSSQASEAANSKQASGEVSW